MRKLLTVRKIIDIKSIPDADTICTYYIDGWPVVDKIGKYSINQLVLFAEIDSWIPTTLAPFLSKGKEPSEYNGVKGERLRTIKLKKQLSQGLILPLSTDYTNGLPYGTAFVEKEINGETEVQFVNEYDDLTEFFDIQLWEKPVSYCSKGGMPKGNWPWFLRKTDQERIQNIPFDSIKDESWYVNEKLDGSSMTVYVNGEDSGVTSKNVDLKEDDTNKWWIVAKKYDLIQKVKSTGRNLAIQGELVGPDTCENKYGLTELKFYGFNVWDIDKQEYFLPKERLDLFRELQIPYCPEVYEEFIPSKSNETRDSLLKLAEGYSDLSRVKPVLQEGFVFTSCTERGKSFKVISNEWLLKYKE